MYDDGQVSLKRAWPFREDEFRQQTPLFTPFPDASLTQSEPIQPSSMVEKVCFGSVKSPLRFEWLLLLTKRADY